MGVKQPKYVTAEEAIRQIKNGDRVAVGHACGEPRALTSAFGAYMSEVKDVEFVHMVGMGDSIHCTPEAVGHARLNSLFLGAKDRVAFTEGRADYTPRYFSQIPALFEKGMLVTDVALVQVSKPDRHGYVSFGVSVDYSMAAAKAAKIKIAQVNSYMPRCHGECFMHISEFDFVVEQDTPLIELKRPELSEVELAIGKNCAALIEDGSTLQLGIGALPDAVLSSLHGKKDLGIHSEMFSDGVLELVEAGVVTNSKKTLHPGKFVATFLMGTNKLYQFVDDNPALYMASVDYTNDPYIIAKNDKMVSINACVQVDLQGQVCSESVGPRQVSGTGGQVDFVRGASMSKGGLSIIAITSTKREGSRIVPFLDEGAAVTTPRNDVGCIVTEYGVADLRGQTLRERARRLINIAHPDFRAELQTEWERRFLMQW
ncbi:MAG: 4-hydroxybutyrate CoA-transferase [Oscillospiraceae bacterium]|nr:4-hydroxybutyrate CoA-transferase [Oscillospiraceae bacterium]